MRLATPRSTPRDDDPNHYLRVIVGMLYVSQGSAGELLRGWWRWCGRDERWRESSARGGRWKRRGRAAGPGWVAMLCGCESLYRKNQPQWKLKPRRSLTHHAHSRCLPGRPVALVDLSSRFSFPRPGSFSVLPPHLLRNLRVLPPSLFPTSLSSSQPNGFIVS